jgi:SAM-dependent methyltransferase
MPQESIVDTSRPSAGRIYDYVLGGSHNFEVDRQAAEQLLTLLPFFRKFSMLQRWTLQDIAVELTKRRGYDVIIDFASGLPTNDHIHLVTPPDTTVIYSDYDPVVVEYAHEILAGTPNVYFFHADAGRPEELLGRPEVQQILNGRRNVAVVYWGITAFLSDEEITHALRTLYEWTGQKGCLAYNAQGADINPDDPAMIDTLKLYEQMGTTIHLRPLAKHVELARPWRPDANGFIPLLQWHGFDESELGQEGVEAYGPMGGGYGAYLIK